MGLDITITRRKKIVCPKCGEVVSHTILEYAEGGGRGWYPLLESLGYYIPYEKQRTMTEGYVDWYGKDMVLTDEQADEAYRFVTTHDLYGSYGAASLIAVARYERDEIVVNANW